MASAKKVDNLTVDLIMKEPNPVLLNHLFNFRVMSKEWAVKNKTESPQNYKDREDTLIHGGCTIPQMKCCIRKYISPVARHCPRPMA